MNDTLKRLLNEHLQHLFVSLIFSVSNRWKELAHTNQIQSTEVDGRLWQAVSFSYVPACNFLVFLIKSISSFYGHIF